jgi:hypothetical protein
MKHWFLPLPFVMCIFFVLLFLVVSIAKTGSAQITFSWTPNSEPDLYCYRIYKTTRAGQYRFVNDDPDNNDLVWEGTENTATITADEACFFVVTTVDIAGNESDPSNEVAYEPSSSSGCFVATAAFGSPMEPYVKVLREFRDRFLLNNTAGKSFVRLYYRYSPPLADFITRHENFQAIARWALLPLIGMSYLVVYLGPAPTLLLMVLAVATTVAIRT